MTDHTGTYEELAYRMHDDVAVSLVWRRADNRVRVLVADLRAGHSFEVPVGDDSPLEVFNHPFAYAGFRCVEHDGRLGDAVGTDC